MPTSDGDRALPDVLEAVTLRLSLPDGGTAELPSRVLDLEERDATVSVVVGRPDLSGLPDAGTYPHRGEELALLWTRPSGMMRLRATARVGIRPYGPIWALTPTGAPTRDQRRQFFRIELSVPATLTPVVDGVPVEQEPVPATLVEVSEGGALVTCRAAVLPEVGGSVELSFTLHDRQIRVEAEVLRHETAPTGAPRIAVRFLDADAHGDHIRRVAFKEQRGRVRRPD